MSEILESFEFGRYRRPGRYPWDEWTDGRIWRIHRGIDYDCQTDSMGGNLYRHAERWQLRVVVHLSDDSIVFRFTQS